MECGLGPDVTAGAGAVLDDDRLPPFLRQEIGDDARHGVGGAAGRERHDDLHGAGRIILRGDAARQRDDGNKRRTDAGEPTSHDLSPISTPG